MADVFVYGAIAELLDEPSISRRAITLLDTLMMHIIKNNWYLIDFDGKPTTWGKWNPDYVNALPVVVGDRNLNSSNIIAMLQTAHHFTGKTLSRWNKIFGGKQSKMYSHPMNGRYKDTMQICFTLTVKLEMATQSSVQAIFGCCPTGWADTWV